MKIGKKSISERKLTQLDDLLNVVTGTEKVTIMTDVLSLSN